MPLYGISPGACTANFIHAGIASFLPEGVSICIWHSIKYICRLKNSIIIYVYISEKKPHFYLIKLAALHNELHNFPIHTYRKRSSRKNYSQYTAKRAPFQTSCMTDLHSRAVWDSGCAISIIGQESFPYAVIILQKKGIRKEQIFFSPAAMNLMKLTYTL